MSNVESAEIQLALVNQKLTTVEESIEEIKQGIRDITMIASKIAALELQIASQIRDSALVWTKLDVIREDGANTEKKLVALENKIIGGWKVFIVLMSLVQVAVIAFVGWTFEHLQEAEKQIVKLESLRK